MYCEWKPYIHSQSFKLILKFCFFHLQFKWNGAIFSIFDPYRMTYHVMDIIAIPNDSPEKMQKKRIQKKRDKKNKLCKNGADV